MRSMNSYSKTAMERAMKVQEVILPAMAKKISWVAGGRDYGDQGPVGATVAAAL